MLFPMQLIQGKTLAEHIRTETAADIISFGLSPALGVLLVGDDPASDLYVRLKQKAAEEIGIRTDIRRLSRFAPDEELIAVIEEWNTDSGIHGILVQLPLPEGHDTDRVIAAMDPNKDVDGFHPESLRKLLSGGAVILPPVHEGVLRLIASTGITINKAKTSVIANSKIFSEPLIYILKKAGAFVSDFTPDDIEKDVILDSDIIIIAVGRPKFLTRDMVKSNAVVVDVGTNRLSDGKLVGDADQEHLQDIPGWITPVPGGVGPMTIAILLKNVVELAKRKP